MKKPIISIRIQVIFCAINIEAKKDGKLYKTVHSNFHYSIISMKNWKFKKEIVIIDLKGIDLYNKIIINK
jgi:hypothetical protein